VVFVPNASHAVSALLRSLFPPAGKKNKILYLSETCVHVSLRPFVLNLGCMRNDLSLYAKIKPCCAILWWRSACLLRMLAMHCFSCA
jgi:hypothetical protein